jgi:PPM family protein phosphatase
VGSKSFKNPNQDAGDVYRGEHCSAVAIADGLGSSLDAHIASTRAVRVFLTGVRLLDQQANAINPGAVQRLWSLVVRALEQYYTHNAARYYAQPNALQTTLAAVIELADSYLISYLGNGSLFHIRGDFWNFWERRWPWCVTDLMLGHSFLSETGKDTLYGIVAPTGLTAEVRVLQLWKDTTYGDLLVLCTDGISSPDHLRVGRDANNKLWLEVNPHIDTLLNQFLKPYFTQLRQQNDTAVGLEQALQTFLQAQAFDDDATIGILVSRHARDYYLAHHPGTAV